MTLTPTVTLAADLPLAAAVPLDADADVAAALTLDAEGAADAPPVRRLIV